MAIASTCPVSGRTHQALGVQEPGEGGEDGTGLLGVVDQLLPMLKGLPHLQEHLLLVSALGHVQDGLLAHLALQLLPQLGLPLEIRAPAHDGLLLAPAPVEGLALHRLQTPGQVARPVLPIVEMLLRHRCYQRASSDFGASFHSFTSC